MRNAASPLTSLDFGFPHCKTRRWTGTLGSLPTCNAGRFPDPSREAAKAQLSLSRSAAWAVEAGCPKPQLGHGLPGEQDGSLDRSLYIVEAQAPGLLPLR